MALRQGPGRRQLDSVQGGITSIEGWYFGFVLLFVWVGLGLVLYLVLHILRRDRARREQQERERRAREEAEILELQRREPPRG